MNSAKFLLVPLLNSSLIRKESPWCRIFLVPDQFFLDMHYDEVIMDDAGATTTQNQAMQLVI